MKGRGDALVKADRDVLLLQTRELDDAGQLVVVVNAR